MSNTQNQSFTQPQMRKYQAGVNEDGTPHFRYEFDGPEGGGVIRTGPVSATIALKDGTVYDLTEDYVAHHPGHAGPIAHHIEMLQERSGRVIHADGSTFRHVCGDDCGEEAIPERIGQRQPLYRPAEEAGGAPTGSAPQQVAPATQQPTQQPPAQG